MDEVRLGSTVDPDLVSKYYIFILIGYECPYVMKPEDDNKRTPVNISFSQ